MQKDLLSDYRRNYLANLFDGMFFFFGMSFVTANTVLPAYVHQLGGSNLLVGLTPALATMGWLIPQVFIANHVERLPVKKPFVLWLGAGQRLAWLLMFAATWAFGRSLPRLTLGVWLLLYFTSQFLGGLSAPAWFDMVAKVTPVERRGSLFAWRFFLGNLTGIGAGWVVTLVLERVAAPQSYGLLFLLAFATTSVSLFFFLLLREPLVETGRERVATILYLRRLPEVLQRDQGFRWFMVANVFLSLGTMASAFWVVDALARFPIGEAYAGRFTMVLLLSQTFGTPFFGYLGDRLGHKLNLVVSGACAGVASLLPVLTNSLAAYTLVFVAFGLSAASAVVSKGAITVEFCRAEERPTYIGLSNTLIAPFTFMAPLVGGWLADRFGYLEIFWASTLLTALGTWILLVYVSEPRRGITVTRDNYKFGRTG